MADKIATQTGDHITLAGGGDMLKAEQPASNGHEDEATTDNLSSIISVSEIT